MVFLIFLIFEVISDSDSDTKDFQLEDFELWNNLIVCAVANKRKSFVRDCCDTIGYFFRFFSASLVVLQTPVSVTSFLFGTGQVLAKKLVGKTVVLFTYILRVTGTYATSNQAGIENSVLMLA